MPCRTLGMGGTVGPGCMTCSAVGAPRAPAATMLQARPTGHAVCASKEPRGVLAFGGHIQWPAMGPWSAGEGPQRAPPPSLVGCRVWTPQRAGPDPWREVLPEGPGGRGTLSSQLCSPGMAGCSRHCPAPLQENLRQFVDRVFSVITKSGVSCPTVMCDIFFSLREAAAKRFQGECLWAPHGEAYRPQRTRRPRQG